MEMEIRIVVYSPVSPNEYIADVYKNGERVFCGYGHHVMKHNAIEQAAVWIVQQSWNWD